MPRFLRSLRDAHPRLVVAGGGIGGVEAALALRALAGDRPAIELVAPEPEFAYRAMSVTEPFGSGEPMRIGYDQLERNHAVHHRAGAIASVDSEAGTIELHGGERLAYSALVVAIGARAEPWLPGALTFTGPSAVPLVRDLLARLKTGSAAEIVFTAPAGASWTLPLYELALLTSAWCAERSLPAPRLHVITPESAPLEIFGAAATRVVRELLADRGITVHTGTDVTSYEGGRTYLSAGLAIDADAVVALPRLTGNPVPGLPADADGFILVDEHCRVTALPDVYAVGGRNDAHRQAGRPGRPAGRRGRRGDRPPPQREGRRPAVSTGHARDAPDRRHVRLPAPRQRYGRGRVQRALVAAHEGGRALPRCVPGRRACGRRTGRLDRSALVR
jgi:sulfide:quinone oxidoreductase